MFPSNSRSFRKEQIKRRKRLQTKKRPKRDPILNQLADPEYFGWNTKPLNNLKGNHD
jgi:hypothetical protein